MSSELLTALAGLTSVGSDQHSSARFERLQSIADAYARDIPDAAFKWNSWQIWRALTELEDANFSGALRRRLALSAGMSDRVRAGALVSMFKSARFDTLFEHRKADAARVAVNYVLHVIQLLAPEYRFEPLTLLSRAVASPGAFPAAEIAYATWRIASEVERALERVADVVPAALTEALARLLSRLPEDRQLGLFEWFLAIASPPPQDDDELLAAMLRHLADFVFDNAREGPLSRFADFLDQYPAALSSEHSESMRLLTQLVVKDEMEFER
jgi:hypothetical protein